MIPEEMLEEKPASREGKGTGGRKLIPLSVKANRVFLATALAVLLVLGLGLVWTQAGGAKERRVALTPTSRAASITINTPTPTRERKATTKPTRQPEPTSTEPATDQPKPASPTAIATKEAATPTPTAAPAKRVALGASPTPRGGSGGEIGPSKESISKDANLPSTGVNLWLPIQGVSAIAFLFLWRELRWRRTGR